jgi:hypothetical protein
MVVKVWFKHRQMYAESDLAVPKVMSVAALDAME